MDHPPFVKVRFYPATETATTRTLARYVALACDGQVYVLLTNSDKGWEKL